MTAAEHTQMPTLQSEMELHFGVSKLIAREADFLARGMWPEWLALFETDGIYWMPADPGQTDPLAHVSHIYENAELRELRVNRFIDDNALSLQPRPRIARHLTNLLVEQTGDGIQARATLLAAQYAYGSTAQFHGHVTWQLRRRPDGAEGFGIKLKRVDLLNSDGPLSDILSYL